MKPIQLDLKTKVLLLSLAGLGVSRISSHKPKEEVSRASWPAAPEELLRMNWGKPGFCTEYATDYDPKVGRCLSGGKPYRRKFISSE